MLLFFEKLIFPTMSKTPKVGQETQGILGVNHQIPCGFWARLCSFGHS
jgi:hypothetical protein